MEALSFMKFWLTNNTNGKPRREIKISESVTELRDPELELNEGEDSFFELEISLSDFSLKQNKTTPEKQKPETTSFTVSKSKVLPLLEPQSPVTNSKSGQKFRAFSFKKSMTKENNTSLNVRFRHEDNETTSFRKTASIANPQLNNDTMFDDSVSSSHVSSSSSSKRFFSLIKPLYTKKQSINSVTTSPAAREKQRKNIPSGIRRQLGKSRSASAAVGGMSPANRVDDSLQVQQDGIQSAILHCKKSFHGSSRESSLLSRSTSESSSHEKLSTSSSEDSYLFSRIASDSMSEKSLESLTSIKEKREKICD